MLALALSLGVTGTAGAATGTLDVRLARVAHAEPAFGGMFERKGVLHVYLTDRSATARAAAKRALRRSNFKVLKARYGFAQLELWKKRLTAGVLGHAGAVLTDIDDRRNRLTVGVKDKRTRLLIEARIAALGIPKAAVRIEEVTPPRFTSSLNDFHRPLVAGLQISFSHPSFSSLCTLGFNAVRKGVSGFVTNSHCTGVQGGVEGTVYFQPDQANPANRVGVETVDPVYFRGGICAVPTRRCRFSDSAFVKRDSGVPASQGFIAKADPSVTTWNGTDTYRITSKGDAIVGQFVEKVGRTTGRTGAPVVRTCTDILVNFSNILLLCQSQANLFALPGDSGSPVFTPNGSNAKLRGELWGGNVAGDSYFSPISSIQRSTELGKISVCAPGFSC
jgi:hypothetical protein